MAAAEGTRCCSKAMKSLPEGGRDTGATRDASARETTSHGFVRALAAWSSSEVSVCRSSSSVSSTLSRLSPSRSAACSRPSLPLTWLAQRIVFPFLGVAGERLAAVVGDHVRHGRDRVDRSSQRGVARLCVEVCVSPVKVPDDPFGVEQLAKFAEIGLTSDFERSEAGSHALGGDLLDEVQVG